MSYKPLGIDERIYIENQLKFKVKISEIAKNLISFDNNINQKLDMILQILNEQKSSNNNSNQNSGKD